MGTQLARKRGTAAPLFGACLLWAMVTHLSYCRALVNYQVIAQWWPNTLELRSVHPYARLSTKLFFRFWPNLVCGRSRLVVHISMTSARSKVTELLKFRKLHFSRSISSAILTWSSKLIQQIRIQNPFVMHRLVQVKKNRIGGATGNCYWEWSAYAAEKTCLRSHLKLFTQVAAWQLKRQVIPDLWHTNRKCLVSHEGRRVKMVDYDSMGPSLHLVRARFLNFLLSKLSRDFKLHGMSILQDFQMAIFPYCSRLQSYGQECW